jgi:hypothetical protein
LKAWLEAAGITTEQAGFVLLVLSLARAGQQARNLTAMFQ